MGILRKSREKLRGSKGKSRGNKWGIQEDSKENFGDTRGEMRGILRENEGESHKSG